MPDLFISLPVRFQSRVVKLTVKVTALSRRQSERGTKLARELHFRRLIQVHLKMSQPELLKHPILRRAQAGVPGI